MPAEPLPLTDAEIAEAERLASEASPGPWDVTLEDEHDDAVVWGPAETFLANLGTRERWLGRHRLTQVLRRTLAIVPEEFNHAQVRVCFRVFWIEREHCPELTAGGLHIIGPQSGLATIDVSLKLCRL